MYEVELKFPVDNPAAVIDRLADWGVAPGEPFDQSDVYFAHPVRDFAASDEAFRLRSVGDWNCMTYKGPVVDTQTKTRREIEVPLGDGSAAATGFIETMQLLGFRRVRDVRKWRVLFHLYRRNRRFEVAVDTVDGLGTFVEIETLADEASREAASEAVLSVARELGLSGPERKSYLSLLLDRDREKSSNSPLPSAEDL